MAAEWQDVLLEGLYTKLSRHLDTLYQHLLFFYSLQFPVNIVAFLGGHLGICSGKDCGWMWIFTVHLPRLSYIYFHVRLERL